MRESYALVGESGLRDLKSDYWTTLLSRGRQGYGGKGDLLEDETLWENFRNNVVTKGLDNANVPDDAWERVRAKWKHLYETLAPSIPTHLRPYLQESPVGNPRVLRIDGLDVTQSSLEYTYMLSHLEPYLEKTRVVVDIGGGYGGLARLIKLARPEVKIVLFDLPEINTVQTYFLSQSFPDATVLTFADLHGNETLTPGKTGADFIVLPGPLVDRLEPDAFEGVINTRSMMEMDLETVSMYLEHIQRKLGVGGFFYCLNRYEKKSRLKDYPFDERWYLSLSRAWPTAIDENPHHELVAIRAAFPVLHGAREHLAALPPYDRVRDRLKARLAGH